jgi:hypothetical protein
MKFITSKWNLLITAAALTAVLHFSPFSRTRLVAAEVKPASDELTRLQEEVNRLKSIATDQSHAMADVGYHFANLWFAGEKKNWPLAKFYFDESRSHLNWAVRVIPIRKDPAGNAIDLNAILQSVDESFLSKIGKAIDDKDTGGFTNAYKEMLVGCYACHKAAGKPYLRPQIPVIPPQPIINFDPKANWPN